MIVEMPRVEVHACSWEEGHFSGTTKQDPHCQIQIAPTSVTNPLPGRGSKMCQIGFHTAKRAFGTIGQVERREGGNHLNLGLVCLQLLKTFVSISYPSKIGHPQP